MVERLVSADLNGDGVAELIVISRSAGSGGYLNADAYVFGESTPLLLQQVQGLEPEVDPVEVLQSALSR